MKVSKNWLNEYIDIKDIDYQEIVNKMPLIGNEIEAYYKLCEASSLVIGKVLTVNSHPDSEKLHICEVDVKDEILQIVCGAKNVREDIKVIVAKIGAKLPGNIEIKKASLRGIESNGMICALEELGIDTKFVPEISRGGIHILDDDAPIGSNALEYLCYDDSIMDVELTANRSDLLSMIGMAYELGAVYDKKVILPNTEYVSSQEDINNSLILEVDTVNCPLYIAKKVCNIEIHESPNFIKARLIAGGIRPINNVVDISNYVMLEYGQPLHFFDSDKLGNKINVRMAKENEELTTLDGIKRILNTDDIVITDGSNIVALAGVMGGENTEVENTTKNIVIESAIFNPVNIRHTSKTVLRSEASARFEKGLDTNRTFEAINRACHLLQKYANATILTGQTVHNEINKTEKIIKISLEKINKVLGMTLSKEEILDIFVRLGFSGEEHDGVFMVIVPSRRLDISIAEDLIEEIGRIHGYDNMIGELPILSIKSGKLNSERQYERKINNYLRSIGVSQVQTYTLVSENDIYKFTNKDFEYIELESPMSEDRKIARYSLIPSLLNVCEYNNYRNINDINIFENSKVYYRKNNEIIEEIKVAGVFTGKYITNNWENIKIDVDFYFIKGIIESLLDYLKLNGRYEFRTTNLLNDLHPGKSASIYVDNEYIGYMGRVHPSINKKEIYVFELFINKLMNKKIRNIKYKDLPKYPSINKDMAFILDKNISVGDVFKTIKKQGGKILTDIDVFDIYTGNNIDPDKKSVAFSLTFRDNNKTLTDDEVMNIFNKIIIEIEIKFSGVLRNK